MCARLLAAAALGAAVLSGAAGAHHGWGSYDSTRPLTLDGVVSEVMPDNPHAGLMLEVEGRVWQVTLSPPSRMANRGKPIGDIEPGDRVVAVGYPSRETPDERSEEHTSELQSLMRITYTVLCV